MEPSGVFAGQSHRHARTVRPRIRSRFAHPKVCVRVSVVAMGRAHGAGKAGLLEAKRSRVESRRSRSLDSTLRVLPRENVHANGSQRASPALVPKRESWCVFVAVPPTEIGQAAAKSPRWVLTAEAVRLRWGALGAVCRSSYRSNSACNRFPKAASHQLTTEVVCRCKTRGVGIRRLLPWGSFPFGV